MKSGIKLLSLKWRLGFCFIALLLSVNAYSGSVNVALGSTPVTISQNVISIDEMRFRNTIRQSTDFSCAAASLATLLKYSFNLDLSELDVISAMYKVIDPKIAQSRGFSMLEMKKYLQTIGMRGRGYRVGEQKLRKMQRPAIVLINTDGYKHFVVLKGIKRDTVFLSDPSLGNIKIQFENFIELWANRVVFSVFGENYEKDNELSNLEQDSIYHNLDELLLKKPNGIQLDYGSTTSLF